MERYDSTKSHITISTSGNKQEERTLLYDLVAGLAPIMRGSRRTMSLPGITPYDSILFKKVVASLFDLPLLPLIHQKVGTKTSSMFFLNAVLNGYAAFLFPETANR